MHHKFEAEVERRLARIEHDLSRILHILHRLEHHKKPPAPVVMTPGNIVVTVSP